MDHRLSDDPLTTQSNEQLLTTTTAPLSSTSLLPPPPPPIPSDNLVTMKLIDNESITSKLFQRYQAGQHYTYLGSRLITAILPNSGSSNYHHKDDQLVEDDDVKPYVQDFRNVTSERTPLPAHLYQLAASIYLHVRRSGLDQAIIFMGDTGSGKTRSKSIFLKGMAGLRASSKKETKVFHQIQQADLVFTAFGTATTTHINASQFGSYIELQFDSKGRILGAKHLDYLLDKARVTSTPRNESNLMVFYQLLAGMTNEEKQQFQLLEPSHYHYLTHTHPDITHSNLNSQFHHLKGAMRSLGFTKKFQSQVFQVVAAILHLGNIKFANAPKDGGDEAALIANDEVLTLTADLLGLHPTTLEGILIYKTQAVKKEMCTVFLDPIQSAKQRDELAKCLFSLLFSWITEHINTRLCFDKSTNFVGLLDIPGFQNKPLTNGFTQFCVNFFNERLYNYMCYQIFEASNVTYAEDGISVPAVKYNDNTPLVHLFTRGGTGLVATFQKQANRSKGPASDASVLQAFQRQQGENPAFTANSSMNQFTIQHYYEPVIYEVTGLMEANLDAIAPDFVQTFRGDSDVAVGNAFVTGLFNSGAVQTESHPRDSNAIISAQSTGNAKRQPAQKNKKGSPTPDEPTESTKGKIIVKTSKLQVEIDNLFDTFDNSETWFVVCLQMPARQGDWSSLFSQVDRYGLGSIAERKQMDYTVCYLHDEFVGRYQSLLESLAIDTTRSPLETCDVTRSVLGWESHQMAIGTQYVYLEDDVWRELEDHLRAAENGDRNGRLGFPLPGFLGEDNQSVYSDDDQLGDDQSQFGNDSQMGDLELVREVNHLQVVEEEVPENLKPPKSKIRRTWICCTWGLTWWIPGACLSWCGRMKRKDVQMAWREKVALCMVIFLLSAAVIFFIVGLNPLICPERDIYTPDEIQSTKESKTGPLYSMYGRVYDMNAISGIKQIHYQVPYHIMSERYSGENLENAFPIQINPNLCLRYDGQEIHPQVSLSNVTTDPLLINHDHRWYRGEGSFNPYWFEDVIRYRMKKVGEMAYTQKEVETEAGKGRLWFMYEDRSSRTPVMRVYDFSRYNNIFLLPREDEDWVPDEETRFLGKEMETFINTMKGKNVTHAFNTKLHADKPEMRARILQCMNNLFYAGVVDDHNSAQCRFAQYLLLGLSVGLFMMLFVKFLASLQLGSRPNPEDHDKFIICNVPCYTEDEESLKRTLESLAVLKYDDKRKLLFVIADGMVIGGGNDLPTPRIVLNLFGSDPNLEPEPLSFLSLGEGTKQHNMGKVYTGLYEVRGHVVPYMVIVKVGKASERNKPGNRGKRDSQLILMNFFNKVHYDHPMVPMELEMYHQIKNIIGVDPHLYEFVLMVDADTVVMPDSLNRLVSVMLHDTKVMGVCGETSLMNERTSWATMIQVYEYFISHHLSKAFESLFGSVTCLPGCFSMYRIWSPVTDTPLLVSNTIVEQYSENVVDTLHKKNLLHLGEDRYLTTLLLKNFPFHKMTFTPDAKCITNAPDTWQILLSQRRRWINSTIHNLLELVLLPRLCGFCCFSMRFVVFLDLISTVIMPATLGYLGYLAFRLITDRDKTISLISLFFIIAPYALQMIVFLVRRQWQHVGWMIIYLMALPMFALFIPLYSFWNFDDFSWGNTRVVLGEGGKRKKVAAEEGHFDPATIPTRRWQEYEEEAWEATTEKTLHSDTPPSPRSLSRYGMRTASPNPYKMTSASPNPYHQPYQPRSASPNPYQPRSASPNPYLQPYPTADLGFQFAAMHQPSAPTSYRSSYYSQVARPDTVLSHHPLHYPPSIPSHPLAPLSRSGTPTLPPPIPTLPTYRPPPHYPPPTTLVPTLRSLLAHSDLMTLSKRQVRQQLAHHYQLDFEPYREQITKWIELIVQGQL